MRISIKPESLEQIDDLLDEFIETKRSAEEATRRLKMVEEQLLKSMELTSEKTKVKKDGGKYYRATYVRNTQTKVNEDQLKEQLGEEKYAELCDLKLNKKKLEEAANTGEVPLTVVAAVVTEVPGKPYIRYTEGVDSDDQSS